jgi:isopenicillin N synthase-like dioxygenase
MVETIADGAIGPYADFDNRFLARDAKAGVERAALGALPVIDVSPFAQGGEPAERRRVAREIRKACVDIGFFYIVGHGIEAAEIEACHDWTRRFFELPAAEKAKIDRNKSPTRQGWRGPGVTEGYGRAGQVADWRENIGLVRDVLPGEPEEGRYNAGESQWPDEAALPGFRAFMTGHIGRRFALGRTLARAFALSLELPEDYFDASHRFMGCMLSLNWYPSLARATMDPTQWGISPHSDYGTVTLLSQDALGGLEVRNAAGAWIDVPPIPGSFVVNVGELMALWTNDLYAPSLHRATNVDAPRARVSAAFFTYPHGRTRIECLPTCRSEHNPPRYEPVIAEEFTRALIEQANRHGRPGILARRAERFKTA